MPTYDYRCQSCSQTFEVRMSMSEYAEGKKPACPRCGSSDVDRAFTSFGVLTASRGGSGGSSFGGSCGHGGFT